MNVDLEALCKVYLMSCGSDLSELSDILGDKAQDEADDYMRKLRSNGDVPAEEAEFLVKLYKGGITYGLVTLFMVFKDLIKDELEKEQKVFEKETGMLCPVCNDYGLFHNGEYVPGYNATLPISCVCLRCGYKHEFPKAMLVRDIYTEYANKQKEEEE